MENERRAGPSLGRVILSVLAGMVGVQSSRRHAEDFATGRAGVYIAVGLLATLLFVLTVWGVVQLVLRSAGV